MKMDTHVHASLSDWISSSLVAKEATIIFVGTEGIDELHEIFSQKQGS